MKKTYLLFISTIFLTGAAFADICSDITSSYDQLMSKLWSDTQVALSVTTDPMEIQAIRQSYDMQLTMLQTQKETALISAGCLTTAPTLPGTTDPTSPPTTDPTPPPTTDPTSPGTTDPTSPPTTDPTSPPSTDPTGPGTTDPTSPPTTGPTSPPTTDPTSPGTNPPGPGAVNPPGSNPGNPSANSACAALISRLRAEGLALQGNKPGFNIAAQHVHAHKAEVVAACGNYGTGRSLFGGND